MNGKDIYQQMIDVGAEIDNHESDLYIKVTPSTRQIVDDYQFKGNVTTFTSQVDGCQWFDIPFAFKPWWTKRGMA
jgi:hypothetical protein